MQRVLDRTPSFVLLTLATLALSALAGGGAHATIGTCDNAPGAGPVEIEATGGDLGPTAYASLGAAFAAVNAGTHTGDINVEVCASTSEGANPAVLHSSGADLASYTSLSIRPLADGLTIDGAPTTGRGVLELNGADSVTIDGDNPNSGGTNRDLTISNSAAATVAANSVIRIATSTAVTSADNNVIKNLILNGNVTGGNVSTITSSTSSSGISFAIYVGGNGGATATTAPTPITTSPAAAPSGTTVNALVVDNNAINQCARGVFFNGAATSVSTGVTVRNNVIGASGSPSPATPPYTSPATTVYGKAIQIAGTSAVSVTGNTIQNIVSYVGIAMAGVELTSAIGSGTIEINDNTISTVVLNSATTTSFASRGVAVLNAAGPFTVRNNSISDVENFSSSSTQQPTGIHVVTVGAGTLELNRVTKVYNRSTGTFGCQGVSLSGGNGHTVRNNVIVDVNQVQTGGASLSPTFGVLGLRVNTGTGHKIYHNSVSLFGTVLGTQTATNLSAAFGIATTAATGADVRNNIFSNTTTGGTTSIAHVAVFLPSSATSTMNLTWNNNAYYTGTTAGVHGVAHVGTTYTAVPAGPATFAGLYTAANFNPAATTPNANFRAYTSTLSAGGQNDGGSLASSAAAPFASATDLHINTGLTITPLESGGASAGITGVTADIDGQVRPGPAGSVNGGAINPDIGADEFDGVPLAANDIGASGFVDPTNGGFKPAGIAFSPQASFNNAGLAAQSNIPVRYRILDAGNFEVYNDVQNIASLSNGASTTVTFASTTLAAGSYTIKAKAENPGDQNAANDEITGTLTVNPPLCGTYNVGSGGDFTSLTNTGGAFASLNSSGASCNIVLAVISDLTAETGAVALNELPGGFAVLIKPSGGDRTISGASAASSGLITLNGADNVTIDGSLSAATLAQNMTIINTNTGGVCVWLRSAGPGNGASNITIQNMRLSGAGSAGALTIAGVLSSSSTFGSAADAPHNNNRILNNTAIHLQNALFLFGNAATLDQNWEISDNSFGSTVVADKLSFRGIFLGNAASFTIQRNTIAGINSSTGTSSTMSGIQIFGTISGGTIARNRISDVKHNNTTGWGSNGIFLAATSTASNVLVVNNFIWDVASQGFNGVDVTDNGYGLAVTAGGGYRIYNNSINLNTNQGAGAAAGITAPINILAAVTTAGAVDLRNNILSSTQTLGTRFGIINAATASVAAPIDYNDYSALNVGRLGATTHATLAAWQGVSGGDTNSLAVAPGFVSDTDLHLNVSGGPSPVENEGISLAEVLNDIDGDARGAAPEMGADEVDACSGVVCAATACGTAACDPAGLSGNCNTLTAGPAGPVCRGAASICDVEESCDGVSALCPADVVVGAGLECRGSADVCDVAESCDGLSGLCPADGFSTGNECRAAVGTCDVAESCDGSGAACPTDVVVAADTECRASGGDCDIAESCDGSSGLCPTDAFEPSTTECRASSGAACDPAEFCTGKTAACPPDAVDQNAPVGMTVTLDKTAGTTITWTEVDPGPFNVYRGFLDPGAFAYNHTCFAQEVAGTSTTDTDTPIEGRTFYYLISRVAPPCLESSLGFGTGGERPNTSPCPSLAADSDGDDVVDIFDNCPSNSNVTQIDVDLDGRGDACDPCPNGEGCDLP